MRSATLGTHAPQRQREHARTGGVEDRDLADVPRNVQAAGCVVGAGVYQLQVKVLSLLDLLVIVYLQLRCIRYYVYRLLASGCKARFLQPTDMMIR